MNAMDSADQADPSRSQPPTAHAPNTPPAPEKPEATEATDIITLAAGDYTAGINPIGGGLHHLQHRGLPLIETYTGTPPKKAGVVLAPWPNRTDAGRFTWRGHTHYLPITEPERNNASHGLVFDQRWRVNHRDGATVTLFIDIGPELNWPWELTLTARYALSDAGLTAQFSAETPDAEAQVPFAFGLHTYLSPLGLPVDECELHVGVDKHYLLNERMLPTGVHEPARLATAIKDLQLDDLFHRSPGTAIELSGARGTTRMTVSENLEWLQIFTPNDFPGRGRAIATEPMSAPPNALATGNDLATIDLATPWSAELTIAAFPIN